MIQYILINLDAMSFIISIFALVISIYSIWYTKRRNKHSLEIDDCYYLKFSNSPYQLSFDVVNNSTSGIRILDVSICDVDNQPVKVIEYDPVPITSPQEFASPFNTERFLEPNNRIEISNYVKETPDNLIIKVSCNKPISWFSKSKTFLIHPVKSD